jgi:hypothetical protein
MTIETVQLGSNDDPEELHKIVHGLLKGKGTTCPACGEVL